LNHIRRGEALYLDRAKPLVYPRQVAGVSARRRLDRSECLCPPFDELSDGDLAAGSCAPRNGIVRFTLDAIRPRLCGCLRWESAGLGGLAFEAHNRAPTAVAVLKGRHRCTNWVYQACAWYANGTNEWETLGKT